MRRPALAAVLTALSALLAAACSPTVEVPDSERERAARELTGARGYLQVAVHATQLFGDETKLLLSDAPLDSLELLESPGGEIVRPPAAERILPPGTPVVVEKVEFPTGWVIAKRMMRTPRYHPWVYLRHRGPDGDGRPLVVVLSQLTATSQAVRSELARVVGENDPSPRLEALPAPQREAVLRKELVASMSTAAVELAWGYPMKKSLDRPAATEDWRWDLGDRRAWFEGGKLTRWKYGATVKP